MDTDKCIMTVIITLILTIGGGITLYNFKEERVTKFYVEQGYQQVVVRFNNMDNIVWQKIKQPEAEAVK